MDFNTVQVLIFVTSRCDEEFHARNVSLYTFNDGHLTLSTQLLIKTKLPADICGYQYTYIKLTNFAIISCLHRFVQKNRFVCNANPPDNQET